MSNANHWESVIKQIALQDSWLASVPCEELKSTRERALPLRVAACWYHFSIFAVDFLCLALPLLHNHENRAYVAQTVNEELGNGIPEKVHSVLLLEALAKAGIDKCKLFAYPTTELDKVLEPFKKRLLSTKSDYEVAGFFLGFELLAEHNISHIFECLQPCECSREELRQTEYFQEHFQVEPEHIKRAITMGINSCSGDRDIKSMLDTYHYGIAFWNDFWEVVHQDIFDLNSLALTKTKAKILDRQPLLTQV